MYNVTDPRTIASVRLYVKLARASRAVAARTEARLAALGLTHTQLGVLEALLHLGPLTQRVLIQKVLTSPGNMTDVIDKLTERGLVTRCRVMRWPHWMSCCAGSGWQPLAMKRCLTKSFDIE
jgi:MarR family 2-MHQ and catechol resistance regulon transcriptional repressor